MALHEKQKSAKIIEEISSFLIDRGYRDLSVHLLLGKEESVFTVRVRKRKEDLIKVFREELYCCREIELEEYGVDHLHNDDCVCKVDNSTSVISQTTFI